MEGRCATCRFAVSSGNQFDETMAEYGFPLLCGYAELFDWGAEGTEELKQRYAGRACVTIDGSGYRGDLYVKPDFGCVQWEAKP